MVHQSNYLAGHRSHPKSSLAPADIGERDGVCWQVELRQDVLTEEVNAVLNLVRIRELNVELVAGLEHQG